jgi:glutamate:Na+ symporter, ESS family
MNTAIALPGLHSLLAGALVLVIGTVLAERVPFLARYNIPAPIVGGLLFAALALVAQKTIGLGVTLDTTAKSPLLLLFFASVGLTADIGLLKRGGVRLVRFLLCLFPFLFLQNALGLLMAKLLGLHPAIGLIAGSITLIGGHGTGAAYADRFAAEHDLLGLMGLTMTSATLGLVLGGIIGGPVASRLIRRLPQSTAPRPATDGGAILGPVATPVTTYSVMLALSAALIAVTVGGLVANALEGGAVTVPSFLWCLIAGLIIRNAGPLIGLRTPDAAADLIGSTCLSLFLVWTMMTLDLASVAATAGPLLLILAAQTVLVATWATWVVFRVSGRDYEAAVTTSAFCGFAMGATATAIANMQALARRHGPAPESFVMVPIVGAFFVDLMNLAVLTLFLLPGFS